MFSFAGNVKQEVEGSRFKSVYVQKHARQDSNLRPTD